jgi:hypothetical protein
MVDLIDLIFRTSRAGKKYVVTFLGQILTVPRTCATQKILETPLWASGSSVVGQRTIRVGPKSSRKNLDPASRKGP